MQRQRTSIRQIVIDYKEREGEALPLLPKDSCPRANALWAQPVVLPLLLRSSRLSRCHCRTVRERLGQGIVDAPADAGARPGTDALDDIPCGHNDVIMARMLVARTILLSVCQTSSVVAWTVLSGVGRAERIHARACTQIVQMLAPDFRPLGIPRPTRRAAGAVRSLAAGTSLQHHWATPGLWKPGTHNCAPRRWRISSDVVMVSVRHRQQTFALAQMGSNGGASSIIREAPQHTGRDDLKIGFRNIQVSEPEGIAPPSLVRDERELFDKRPNRCVVG